MSDTVIKNSDLLLGNLLVGVPVMVLSETFNIYTNSQIAGWLACQYRINIWPAFALSALSSLATTSSFYISLGQPRQYADIWKKSNALLHCKKKLDSVIPLNEDSNLIDSGGNLKKSTTCIRKLLAAPLAIVQILNILFFTIGSVNQVINTEQDSNSCENLSSNTLAILTWSLIVPALIDYSVRAIQLLRLFLVWRPKVPSVKMGIALCIFGLGNLLTIYAFVIANIAQGAKILSFNVLYGVVAAFLVDFNYFMSLNQENLVPLRKVFSFEKLEGFGQKTIYAGIVALLFYQIFYDTASTVLGVYISYLAGESMKNIDAKLTVIIVPSFVLALFSLPNTYYQFAAILDRMKGFVSKFQFNRHSFFSSFSKAAKHDQTDLYQENDSPSTVDFIN